MNFNKQQKANTAINSLGFTSVLTQQNVEFFNVNLDSDNEAFVDYNLIKKKAITGDRLAKEMLSSIDSFMKNLFNFAHFQHSIKLNTLLSGLGETNHTSLGFSIRQIRGKAVGNVLKVAIQGQIEHLMESLKQGNFTPNSFYFGLDNIGADRTSDILVGIVKQQLIDFTGIIAQKYNLPTKSFSVPNVYNSTSGLWENVICDLPHFNGRSIILLPKFVISNRKFGEKAFRRFMSFAFEKYVKNDSAYADLIKNIDKGLTKKEYKEFLKRNGIPEKEEFRKFIKKISGLINDFEISYSDDIDFLSDSELELIVLESISKQ
ncbi:hypothetical protein [Mucilaginibacter jinjuensis]|uniref:Uncharacterized protein n=1 Tax=Mucilaginibacter jinjuensis TaxID=1176721 RepID=A0ABY7T424_9SPHI|nr:hypothetical protein [Mucilaginibacter jinjuensis]WCT11014.1 hypothetical protein PQO05_19950 [Mucilaginibacter jinjuensis]